MILQIIVAIAAAAFAVAALMLGDRLRPRSWRHTDDSAATTQVTELINTFFAAVVAFVVVIGWQQYDNAHNHTVAEAKALVDVYATAQDLPEPDRNRIQALVRDYTEQVVGHEWTVMNRERQLSQETQETLDALEDAVGALPGNNPEALELRKAASAGLGEVGQARLDRAMDASYRMPGFLYTALWFVTILLLFGAVFSGVAVTRRSIAMTAVLGAIVGIVIWAIYDLDRPFSGGIVVPKDAFEFALARYQGIG